jgi:ACS family glucarate transporter-like MFS transporter
MLAIFSVLRYLLAQNTSITWERMGLTGRQYEWLPSAWNVGYTLFQVPAGNWADRRGPRFVLALCAASWTLLTVLVSIVPDFFIQGSLAWLISLILLRFVLGITMAGTYPVSARMVTKWFSATTRTRATAAVLVGAPVGIAIAMPLVATVMSGFGWRATFYVTGLLPIPILLWWWLRSSNGLGQNINPETGKASLTVALSFLRNRNILLLCIAYLFNETVLSALINWAFSYIDQVWGKGTVTTGWIASIPFLVAVIAMLATGHAIDRSRLRLDAVQVRRFIAITCAILSAAGLLIVARAPNVLIAIIFLSCSVGAQFGSENSYWSMAIDMSKEEVGTATGLLNFFGSIGFIAGNILVAALKPSDGGGGGWETVFISAATCAAAACLLWLPIRPAIR